MKHRLHLLLLAVLATTYTTNAAVTFDLTFPDVVNDTNVNWDDPNYGSVARATLQGSLNEFGTVFAQSATISLNITSSQATYFASAGTATYQFEPGLRFYDGNTYLKITTGNDVNGTAFDGSIDYSFNYAALNYPDLDGNGIRDVRDFTINIKGLTRHEIIHVLGMSSFISAGASQSQRFTRHDTFLYDSSGNPFVTPIGSLSLAANVNDPNSYFDPVGSGANYRIASQGDYSHLLGVMYPYRASINEDDKTYFATLGYLIVPEPTSAALMLTGISFLACSRLRRTRNPSLNVA